MKTRETSIIMVPGLGNSGPGHWQTRWVEKLSNATRVHQTDWETPTREAWVSQVVRAVEQAPRPVILVAHALGVITCVHAAPAFPHNKVAGAFLVAPSDVDNSLHLAEVKREFAPVPRDPLPFPSLLVASRNDPYCRYERAEDFSYAWGAQLVDAGEAGHINPQSNYGPWPEGILRFASFVARL